MGKSALRNKRKNNGRPVGSKHPALIVLEALLAGLTVDLGGQKYIIGIDVNNDQEKIAIPVYWNGEHRLIGANISLDTFLSLCSKLGNDELWIISSNTALNKINRPEER